MNRCPFCAEEIPQGATKCPLCGSELAAEPPTAFAGAAVGEGALEFSHSGTVHLLGYGADLFGIWDRRFPGGPVRTFPRNDEGWAAAWAEYSRLEPNSVSVSVRGSGYRAPASGTGAPGTRPRQNGFATASLVLGIAGFVLFPVVCSALALVFGYRARRQIAASGGGQAGATVATAGIVLGWIGMAIVVIVLLTAIATSIP